MKQTLEVLNDLESSGVVAGYSLGGAIAALYYSETVDTEDLDVFVMLPPSAHSLVPLGEIYAELKKRGYKEDREHIIIEGIPVQFLPAYNALIEEAVRTSNAVEFEGAETRVPKPEYLMAIMLQTGRHKDRLRFQMFCDQVKYSDSELLEIAERHNLVTVLKQWIR